jgi:hypothetical protein
MYWNRSFISILSILLLLFVGGAAEATIQRVDFCTGQFTKTQPIPMVRTRNSTVIVRGDLVDTITGVTAPSGITVTIGNKTGGGGTSTSVTLTITPGSGVALGNKTIKLNYLGEFGAPDEFIINVKAPTVNSVTVTPAKNVLKGTLVTVTATGTGLSALRVSTSAQNALTNFQNITTNSDTTFSFSGNLQSGVTLNAPSFFDSSFPNASCAAALGGGGITLAAGFPDLTASKPGGVYRPGAGEACAGGVFATTKSGFCDRLAAPTVANPRVEGLVDVGAIIYVVKNSSLFPMPNQTFKVQLKFGINVLKEDIVQSLAAGDHKVLAFKRPENKRKLMRDLNCAKCYDLQQAPFNWTDGQLTVLVDVGNQITESNENNNTVLSD